MQEGSLARRDWIGDRTDKTYYWRLYNALVEQGILQVDGKLRVFTQNYAFASTSAAGAVVNGRSTAGPKAWKIVGTGQSYKEWEAETLSNIES